jgi:DNA-binding PadR family transcriptional regulator
MPSAAFNILVSLAGDDLHGYEIMRRVAEQTGGRTRLGPGTLYSSIRALLEAGYIVEIESPADLTKDERRRYYRLAGAGRKAASAEADRLAELLRIARTRKILRGEHV